jgi:hypothetical protein
MPRRLLLKEPGRLAWPSRYSNSLKSEAARPAARRPARPRKTSPAGKAGRPCPQRKSAHPATGHDVVLDRAFLEIAPARQQDVMGKALLDVALLQPFEQVGVPRDGRALLYQRRIAR